MPSLTLNTSLNDASKHRRDMSEIRKNYLKYKKEFNTEFHYWLYKNHINEWVKLSELFELYLNTKER